MAYAVSFERKPGYMHAVITGRNSAETITGYIQDLIRECTAQSCNRLLVEERLEGPRLGTFDVFKLAELASTEARGLFKAVAYVDVNAHGDLMQFASTVAVNRLLPLFNFSTVAEAEHWLREEAGRDPQDAEEPSPGNPPGSGA
ncbi:MAG: hypothetical protein WB626_04820 [Bacteroidota bacterium]